MDTSNGNGVGVSLFVQGCPFHCNNCFNKETWDFDGGKLWTNSEKKNLFNLINHEYISRFSILGGEPLAKENIQVITDIVKAIKSEYPEKTIWVWSGFLWENYISKLEIIKYIDYIIDGQYIDEFKGDYRWKGSSNQRVIDVQNSLKNNKIILYDGR